MDGIRRLNERRSASGPVSPSWRVGFISVDEAWSMTANSVGLGRMGFGAKCQVWRVWV